MDDLGVPPIYGNPHLSIYHSVCWSLSAQLFVYPTCRRDSHGLQFLPQIPGLTAESFDTINSAKFQDPVLQYAALNIKHNNMHNDMYNDFSIYVLYIYIY